MNRVLMTVAAFATVLQIAAAAPPAIGEKAPDFKLSTPEGKTVQLSEVEAKGPVVLVVLRCYPGYQCPYCNRQVQDFIQKSQGFAEAGTGRVGLSRSAPGSRRKGERVFGRQEASREFRPGIRSRLRVHQYVRAPMGRTTRDGLSIDFPDRSARRHLLQQDRQRAWRTHYGSGNPRRTAETKTFELTIDEVRLALAGFLHAGDRGIIVRDGGSSQGGRHCTRSACSQALSRTLSTHLDSTFPV